jgi:hypothetical protein
MSMLQNSFIRILQRLPRLPIATAVGATLALLTPAAAVAATPTLEDVLATAGATTATFKATVDPNGEATGCALQYVEEAQFESSGYGGVALVPCAPADISGGAPSEQVVVDVSGLKSNTQYHFRFALSNSGGTTFTTDQTFGTFGIERLGLELLGEAHEPLTQAGGHPYDLTTTIALNTTPYLTYRSPDGNLKDVKVQLPPGLVGNPTATEQCTRHDSEIFTCNTAAQVGIMSITLGEISNIGGHGFTQEVLVKPIYNVVPPPGVAAQFSARFNNFANAFINSGVRTDGDYGINSESLNITAIASVTSVAVTLWGVPGNPGHSQERYCREPQAGKSYQDPPCAEGAEPQPETPFLTAPTSCGHPLSTTAQIDSWENPSEPDEKSASTPAMTGCSALKFAPSLLVAPEATSADSPTGMQVELKVPQNESPTELATPDLRKAVVTLPRGMTVNPASASGMVGCTPSQFGLTSPVGTAPIHTTSAPAKCPGASEVGNVEIDTPLLSHLLKGGVYLATPYENPFNSLLAIYIAVDDPASGVVVKLAGHVELGAEGQLTTTFAENPQLPFSDFKLNFNAGQRAALKTPATCGSFQATSVLEPWSHEAPGEAGTPDAEPSSSPFTITSTPAGGACAKTAAEEPNAPQLTAGSTSTAAGIYAPFALRVSRGDGTQQLAGLAITLPQGLVGNVTGIPYCSEAALASAVSRSGAEELASPSCPADTELGTVTAAAGAGSDPFYVQGHAYFAGPYNGAPFSMAIITPAVAGPFDLGDVVVRAGIYINPNTAQVTVKSDEIPSELKGIPLDIRSINVNVSRAGFTLNPTDCEDLAVTGQAVSTIGQTASLSDRFQVGGCEKLTFKPTFKFTTHAGHTRRFGAYVRVNVTSGPGQANIGGVFIELPKILAAREESLKQACSEAQFATNPAGCPANSHVGTAIAHTPLLPVPLTGPAIFVSHGGAAFPDLDAVLQGDGVTVVLKGTTNIVNGVTSSNFGSVPDVPVSSFEMVLPTGSYSALAATANLCTQTVTKRVKVNVGGHVVYRKRQVKEKRTLKMPTRISGHDGALIKKTTVIAVEGCPKLKPAASGKKHKGSSK